jgi:hypothetical protein
MLHPRQPSPTAATADAQADLFAAPPAAAAAPLRPYKPEPLSPFREPIGTVDETSEARLALEQLLIDVARELGRKAGAHGVTISDVRHTAEQRGLMTNQQPGRTLSWLSALMPKAGLSASGRTRRSTIKRSHGNRHTVWVPKDLLASGGGR